jgi:phosphopantothenoylcysteine decarboxylase/phosphopantothenate--cysteine ligase
LAGGDIGAGRLAATEVIVAAIESALSSDTVARDLVGRHVVVSAGGTREPIDAVRVIANRSSGKQGYAVAAEAAARGARVTLVSTVDLPVPAGAELCAVETAAQMSAAVAKLAAAADVIIMAAAVADFRPVGDVADRTEKLKKGKGVPDIVLEPTPDILAGLGADKPSGQVLVGFAAETSDLITNATQKLRSKNLDLIVANDVSKPGVGFQHDTNAVTLVNANGMTTTIGLTDKKAVAKAVVDTVVEILATKNRSSTS